jgi:hypothetical protein
MIDQVHCKFSRACVGLMGRSPLIHAYVSADIYFSAPFCSKSAGQDSAQVLPVLSLGMHYERSSAPLTYFLAEERPMGSYPGSVWYLALSLLPLKTAWTNFFSSMSTVDIRS